MWHWKMLWLEELLDESLCWIMFHLPQDVGLWSSIIMDVFMTGYFKKGPDTFET
jgi:hypothetical protein